MTTFAEFDQLIQERLSQFGETGPRSSNTAPAAQRDARGLSDTHWLAGQDHKRHWSSPRTAGYLAAYVEVGGRRFRGDGIELEDGYIIPDKGVMCSLRVGGCLQFQGGEFVLTEKGEALIAPFVRLEGADAR